jgi:hypothetical protein
MSLDLPCVPDEFKRIRILLLWHQAAPSGISIAALYEPKLAAAVNNKVLSEPENNLNKDLNYLNNRVLSMPKNNLNQVKVLHDVRWVT